MSSIPYRVDRLDDFVREQREQNMKVVEGLHALKASIDRGIDTLTLRMEAHDASKNRWRNWVMGVASAIAVALILFLARMTWIMQSAKLP